MTCGPLTVDNGPSGQYDDVPVNEVCEFVCEDGFTATPPTLTCQDDGEFDATPVCEAIPPPPPGDKEINIKQTKINPDSNGKISVVLFGDPDFDVADVDIPVIFGPGGAEPHKGKIKLKDVNGDGIDDASYKFRTQETGIELGDTEACLSGTVDGVPFTACDNFTTTPGKRGKGGSQVQTLRFEGTLTCNNADGHLFIRTDKSEVIIHDEFCTGTVEIQINFDVEVSKKVKNFETTIQCTDDAGDDNASSEKIKVSKKNGKGVTNECELEDGDSVIGELAPIQVL